MGSFPVESQPQREARPVHPLIPEIDTSLLLPAGIKLIVKVSPQFLQESLPARLILLCENVFEERNYLPQFVLRQISARTHVMRLFESLGAEGMGCKHTYPEVPFYSQVKKVESPHAHNIENHYVVSICVDQLRAFLIGGRLIHLTVRACILDLLFQHNQYI